MYVYRIILPNISKDNITYVMHTYIHTYIHTHAGAHTDTDTYTCYIYVHTVMHAYRGMHVYWTAGVGHCVVLHMQQMDSHTDVCKCECVAK